MTIMPFGKYKEGADQREVNDCPSDYLQWLLEQEWFEESWPTLKKEVDEVLAEREDQGTHWNKWEEEMNLSEVIYGKGKPFV